MRTLNTALICALVWLSIITNRAHADTIFDNGIQLASVENANASDVEFQNYAADNFTLGTASLVQEIRWTGTYSGVGGDGVPPVIDLFTIQFHAIEAGVPSATALHTYNVGNAVSRTDTGVMLHGSTLFSFTATVPNTLLCPGTICFRSTTIRQPMLVIFLAGPPSRRAMVHMAGDFLPLSGVPAFSEVMILRFRCDCCT